MIVSTKLLVSNIFSIYASTGNKTTSSTAKKPDIPWKKSKAKADLMFGPSHLRKFGVQERISACIPKQMFVMPFDATGKQF